MQAIVRCEGVRVSRHAAVLGCGVLLVATILTQTSMASTAGAVGAVKPGQPPTKTLVVDDDGQEGDQDSQNGDQCGNARFTSIQAAVNKARAGDVVLVCPGVYTEFVQINKRLTLLGQVDAVASVDCFAQLPLQSNHLDPTTYATLERPQSQKGNLVTVAAGGVTVGGLVLQGEPAPLGTPNPVDAAVNLQSDSAGARVHHNLFRLNSLGIDLGSDGSATTRVDHNCLRGDVPREPSNRGTWGMASQRQDFVGGLVDHNETFGHTNFAYGVGDLAPTRDSVFANNVSRQDGTGFFVTGSTNISITGNSIVGGTGSGVTFSPALGPTRDATVSGNEISGFGASPTTGFGISVASNSSGAASVKPDAEGKGVTISDNVLSGNAFGLSVQLVNSGIQVLGNTATDNRTWGIRATLASGPGFVAVPGASFRDNTMLRNGSEPWVTSGDATDINFSANTWAGNVCEHANPTQICGGS